MQWVNTANGATMQVTEEDVLREQAREAAKYSGKYTFIELVLVDRKKKRIGGVDVINPIPYVDDNGDQDFKFEQVGGDVVFKRGPDMLYRERVLDTERNRNFLASHFPYDWWKITDQAVEADIKRRHAKMVSAAAKSASESAARYVEAQAEIATPAADMADDDLDRELARLAAEKERRLGKKVEKIAEPQPQAEAKPKKFAVQMDME